MQTVTYPNLKEKLAGLAVMRYRLRHATEDFYANIGRSAPASPPRFYATAKGNMWRIIDRLTGKTCAFRTTHEKAMVVLDGLERGAASKGTSTATSRNLSNSTNE